VDLVKDTARLEAAYNDAAGVTARFNLNLLRVMNRRLGAGFRLDAFGTSPTTASGPGSRCACARAPRAPG
jgi:uncharacterized SAM-dependent methyltransferase